jgi:hypothetical protein
MWITFENLQHNIIERDYAHELRVGTVFPETLLI